MAEPLLSSDDLLRAIEQLDTPELERVASEVISLKARRNAPSLSHRETELLREINRGLPPAAAERYAELMERRRAETLAPDEHTELLHLTDQVELMEAERIERLAELARLRKTTLAELMAGLGIQPSPNA